MSAVTNVILAAAIGDACRPGWLEEVNRFFGPNVTGFVSGTDAGLPPDWYGGDKRLECFLGIGAFNHLNLDELEEHLHGMQWRYPDSVQLIVREHERQRFRIIDVFPD